MTSQGPSVRTWDDSARVVRRGTERQEQGIRIVLDVGGDGQWTRIVRIEFKLFVTLSHLNLEKLS
jgi:hypothetical protein